MPWKINVPTLLFFAALLGVKTNLSGQITPDLSSIPTEHTRIGDITKFGLISSFPVEMNIYIKVYLRDISGEDLLVLQSGSFSCVSGESNLSVNSDNLRWKRSYARSTAKIDSVLRTGVIPHGTYYLSVVVYDASGEEVELGRNSRDLSVISSPVSDNIVNTNTSDVSSSTSPVLISGYSEMVGVYSNYQPPGSLAPPAYASWMFMPTISFYGFPITGRLFLSTQQSDGQQNMNRFSVCFDAEQFKNALKTRLTEFLQKQELQEKLNTLNQNVDLTQFRSLDNLMKSDGVVQELQQIKILDSLNTLLSAFEDSHGGKWLNAADSISGDWQQVVRDSARNYLPDTSLLARYDSLKAKIKTLAWLEEKRAIYEKMMRKKDELQHRLGALGIDSLDLNTVNKYSDELKKLDFSNPSFLFDKLRHYKLFRRGEKLMYMFRSLRLGTSFPVNTSFTLNGPQLEGVSLELERWGVYGAFHYGITQQPVISPDIHYAAYKRTMVGGTFGYGSKDKSHVHLSVFGFDDDPESIHPRDSLYLYSVKPRSNKVISLDFKVLFWKNRISVYGELAGSQTIRDITIADTVLQFASPIVYNSPSDWFVNIFTQRDLGLNAVTDFAVTGGVEGAIPKLGCRMSMSIRRVGPNFYTLGNPYLMRDILQLEGKINQSLWKRRLNLTVLVRHAVNNTEQQLPITMQMVNVGFDVSLTIPKWPNIRLSMMPVVQSTDSATFNINVANSVISYNLRLKRKKQLMINLVTMIQDARATDSTLNYFMTNVNLQTTLMLKNGISFSLTNGYLLNKASQTEQHTYQAMFTGMVTVWKSWSHMIGSTVYTNAREVRWSMFYQTGVSFLKFFTLNARVDLAQYDGFNLLGQYNQYFQVSTKTMLIARW